MIKIEEKEQCNGCHACYNICPTKCIEMQADEEGFLYPYVHEERCVHCGLCEKTCPLINKHHEDKEGDASAFAVINKNEKIRMQSSSGGVFTLLAEKIIEQNGVVFGAKFDTDFTVVHGFTQTIEGIADFRGSKYVQSQIGNSYQQVKTFLDENKKVLFTGTPCQIGGLYSFLGKDYDNLFTQDFICHGVPSPMVWQKYLDYRKKCAHSEIEKINFRDKKSGWELTFSMSILFKNKHTYSAIVFKDPMHRIFLKHYCLRPTCQACSFKLVSRQADITLADFWGIDNVVKGMNDYKGTSLVFTHSEKGSLLFDSVKEDVIVRKVHKDEAIKHNTSMIKSTLPNQDRAQFLTDVINMDFGDIEKKYCKTPLIIIAKKQYDRFKRKIKRLIKY